jgi:septum formation protein
MAVNLNTLGETFTQSNRPIVLASASPRRIELLRLLVKGFEILPSQVKEELIPGESPETMVLRLARMKAESARVQRPHATIIGADTVVVCDHQVFGKPSSQQDAAVMLRALSGRRHQVLTGVCVGSPGGWDVRLSETTVVFSPLSETEIADYLTTGEPQDKAGGYAIQGYGARFIERVEGCYFNVVGLPMSLLYRMLKEAGGKING